MAVESPADAAGKAREAEECNSSAFGARGERGAEDTIVKLAGNQTLWHGLLAEIGRWSSPRN
jgi:hypothetical protein